MEEKQKLNEKLARWAGFTSEIEKIDLPDEYKLEEWYDPTGKLMKSLSFPSFTKSFDACTKWLIPKLGWCEVKIIFGAREGGNGCYILRNSPEPHRSFSEGESPGHAFCLALEKLIARRNNNAYQKGHLRGPQTTQTMPKGKPTT